MLPYKVKVSQTKNKINSQCRFFFAQLNKNKLMPRREKKHKIGFFVLLIKPLKSQRRM